MKNSMADSAGSLGGAKKDAEKPATKKAKLTVAEVHIRRGHAGGFIAKNKLHNEEGYEQQTHEYPLTSMSQVVKHIRQHLPSDEAKSEATNSTPAAAPENC